MKIARKICMHSLLEIKFQHTGDLFCVENVVTSENGPKQTTFRLNSSIYPLL